MLNKIDPDQTQAWQKLSEHFSDIKNVHMRDLFAGNPERFTDFSIHFNRFVGKLYPKKDWKYCLHNLSDL